MSYLSLAGLSKRYGDFTAVEDFTLDIEQGEFVSLLGPSGCGKTTTLSMIAGFTTPTSGRIEMAGTELSRVPANKRGIGIVFQSYALFPHMTVSENVRFGLDMRRIKGTECTQRVADALELVRMGGFAKRYPRELSGGQRQRVALARALVIRPPLLLLDEPLSNLDAKLREEMQSELRQIQQRVGTTTIMVTHDQSEALSMSDRVVVMRDGRMVQVADPLQTYESPIDAFVSGFVGKTNLLEGRLVADQAGRTMLHLGELRLEIDAASRAAPVSVSLRPEKLRLVPIGQGRLSARVVGRQFAGAAWHYRVETGLGELMVNAPNLGAPSHANGERVDVDWPLAAMHLLDTEPRPLDPANAAGAPDHG
ncbi:ABC transporter ATP-binding protein [Halotalea alkalilenta]|uniref:ABC transporter ATP-binding protein n=1 Tax=Halotalea alkalilenta TaxID=376489 RepID=UPI0006945270|nr:ABC transporter ATP-binding protein [Halotalea alkalilenta]